MNAMFGDAKNGGGQMSAAVGSYRCTGGLAVEVFLGLTNLALGLSLEVFRFALELLARVAGQAADRIAKLAFRLFSEAFGFVSETISREIIRHTSPCESVIAGRSPRPS